MTITYSRKGSIFFAIILFVFFTSISIQKFPLDQNNNIPRIQQETPPTVTLISPQGVNIVASIANTDKQRELGLSGTKPLTPYEGMWFIFPQMGIYPFWMKDMQFPLDIVWVDDQMKIVDIQLNAIPESYPKTFIPKAPARYVLEIPAGSGERFGFFIGDTVSLKK
jgi:uncharacterized membrane protein (UPF0127 family)